MTTGQRALFHTAVRQQAKTDSQLLSYLEIQFTTLATRAQLLPAISTVTFISTVDLAEGGAGPDMAWHAGTCALTSNHITYYTLYM